MVHGPFLSELSISVDACPMSADTSCMKAGPHSHFKLQLQARKPVAYKVLPMCNIFLLTKNWSTVSNREKR